MDHIKNEKQLPQNFDFELNCVSSSASIALGALVGWRLGGVKGFVVGAGLTILDEVLIYYNYISHHYISSFVFSTYITNDAALYLKTEPAKNLVISNVPEILKTSYNTVTSTLSSNFMHSKDVIIFSTAGILTYYFEDFIDLKRKLEIPLNAFLKANKFFDPDDILSAKEAKKIYNTFFSNPMDAVNIMVEDAKKIYYNPYAFNFISSIAITQLKVLVDAFFIAHLRDYEGKNLSNNIIKEISKTNKESPLIQQIFDKKNILYYIVIKTITELGFDFITSTLDGKQVGNIIQKATDIALEYGDKITALNPQEGKKCLNNLIPDISKLSKTSQEIFKIYEKTLGATIALNALQNSGSNLLLFHVATIMPKQILFKSLLSSYKALAEQRADTEAVKDILQIHIIDSAEQIALRNGSDFMNDKFFEHRNEFNLIRRKEEFNKSIKDSIDKFTNIFGAGIDLLYYILEKSSNTNKKDADFFKIFLNSKLVTTYITSFAEGQLSLVGLKTGESRLDTIVQSINFPEIRAKHTISEEGDIVFHNYKLYLDQSIIVEIPYLKIESGKRYALTGGSGCGKSSVLKDLYKGNYGILKSEGEIIRPNNIAFLDQKQYQPSHSTLLEFIYFPRKIQDLNYKEKSKLEKEAKKLLEEFQIDNFISNQSGQTSLIYKLNSTNYQLSGGQVQKINFIQIILSKATHIICDECTTALDKKSLILIQQLLKKYLPNSTIIAVNHHAADDNYEQFYELELHFYNNSVTVKEIISKNLDPSLPLIINEFNATESLDILGNTDTESCLQQFYN